MPSPETIGYAFIGGILPSLIWLHFLLKEDEKCPEPRTLITVAFFAGMLSVPLVIPLEAIAAMFLPDGLPLIVSWAAAEEAVKYTLAALLVLWHREVNESIDLVVYMLTVGLGFAALENALFLIEPFANGHVLMALATDNLRFIGSTLLHVIASSVIGFALAFSFTWTPLWRTVAATTGLILAIALHSIFNFFIIKAGGTNTMIAFFVVWTAALVFFALFEVLKELRYRGRTANVCEVTP